MNDDEHYDTSLPFLAICGDRMEEGSGYFDRTNSVYLVNPTDAELAGVQTSTGGFFSTEHEVLTAEGGPPKHWTVPARSFVCIEATSDDEFDGLVCWWKVAYDSGGERRTLRFGTDKRLTNVRHCAEVPVLGRPGALIRRTLPCKG
jgi:hypothetical protein